MFKENTRDESILYMDLYWVYRLCIRFVHLVSNVKMNVCLVLEAK